jgi:sugar phosphate isomerase/epimerase
MKVGAHSWLLETRYPLPQAMIEARRIGYDGYEVDIGNFGGTGLGLQILPDRMQDEHRDDIRRSAAEAEIEISSLALGALWHYPFTSPDAAYSKRGVEIVQAAIPLARTLGARCILLPIVQPAGLSDREAWSMTVRGLAECLPIAEGAGVILAVENVCSRFLKGAPELGRLVDELASSTTTSQTAPGSASTRWRRSWSLATESLSSTSRTAIARAARRGRTRCR